MSIRFAKFSIRTSFAIAAKSSGLLMSCFGNGMPPFGHSFSAFSLRLLLRRRPADVDLEQLRHGHRVLARLARALAELVPQHRDLLVGRADGDDPVGEPAGPLRVHRPGGGDVDRDRLLGAGVEPRRLEREVVAVVLDDLAAEQLGDDLDRLEHHRAADADLRPLAADDVLVQRLAGAQPEPEAAGVHRAQRGGGVGDDRGVVAEARAGDGGPERQRRARSRARP